jgi:hypothetical protein
MPDVSLSQPSFPKRSVVSKALAVTTQFQKKPDLQKWQKVFRSVTIRLPVATLFMSVYSDLEIVVRDSEGQSGGVSGKRESTW